MLELIGYLAVAVIIFLAGYILGIKMTTQKLIETNPDKKWWTETLKRL